MTKSSFTQAHYRAILQVAKSAGYHFQLFTEEAHHGRRIYLRHDVDNSIEDALWMANIESEYDVRSTFCFLIRSKNYNALHGDSLRMIRAIAQHGHAIGLHYSEAEEDCLAGTTSLEQRIRRDADLLAGETGLPIEAFSFHNPTTMYDPPIVVEGLVNTYADPYFKDIKYVSESNFRWRDGDPSEFLAQRRYDALQILVHPMTYRDELTSDRDALQYFLWRKTLELCSYNTKQNRILTQPDHTLSMEDVAAYISERSKNSN